MPVYPHLDPGPFALPGGDVGVLLLHGFTGTPTEVRGLGEHLHQGGLSVRAPLLPGHGTHHHDLEPIRHGQWLAAVHEELAALQGRCRQVFVVGQSLGGLLALGVAAGLGGPATPASSARQPPLTPLAGIVGLAPALLVPRLAHLAPWVRPLLREVPKYEEQRPDLVDKKRISEVWSYGHVPLRAVGEVLHLQRRVRAGLGTIHQPLLVLQSRRDKTVRPHSAQVVHDGVAATDKELVWLDGSGHLLSVDAEREQVWARVASWIQARA